MKDFTVFVKKITDTSLLRRACESTFLGKSRVSLSTIYKAEHSPVRTQLFWIELKNIPLFVSTHLIRHHVGSVPYQLTCRDDRMGGNPDLPGKVDEIRNDLDQLRNDIEDDPGEDLSSDFDEVDRKLEWLKHNTDRQTPVNLSLLVNAQSLIDMAKLRLCCKAHVETRTVFQAIKDKVALVDPFLAQMMVPKCVYRNGLCGEPGDCRYNETKAFQLQLKEYRNLFRKDKPNQNDRT